MGGRFEAAPFQEGELGFPAGGRHRRGQCSVIGQLKHGDHTVFVGEVKSARLLAVEALNLASTGWNYGVNGIGTLDRRRRCCCN